jgi:hypothetical protein
MGTYLWIVVALAAFDVLLVMGAFFKLRAYPRLDQKTLHATSYGLAGFVFHAFMFFEGPFLVLQLATLSSIFVICWLQHSGRLPGRKPRVEKRRA